MAITRTQYITVGELNEVLGSTYTDDAATLLLINEASETLENHMLNPTTYDVSSATDELKLATAYQVAYEQEIDTNVYSSGSETITAGRTSISSNTGELGTTEYKKISPKAQRYLIKGKLLYRLV